MTVARCSCENARGSTRCRRMCRYGGCWKGTVCADIQKGKATLLKPVNSRSARGKLWWGEDEGKEMDKSRLV